MHSKNGLYCPATIKIISHTFHIVKEVLMRKIRLRSETEYRIEVNDNGEYIVLDVADPTFPLRLAQYAEKVQHAVNKLKTQQDLINKQKDKKGKHILSKNEYKKLTAYDEIYKEIRGYVDELFGEGAAQKIYGDRNWFSMFGDLQKCLEPYLLEVYGDKSVNEFKKMIEKKYGNEESDVI